MPRRLLFIALVCASVLTSALPCATTLFAAPLATSNAVLKERLWDLTQSYHVRAGCAAWKHDARLDTAAQLHAEDIASHQWISHVGTDGATVRQRVRRQGYPVNRASEGIAIYRTPDQAVGFWMGEPPSGPHRMNITWCQYTDAGVGLAYDRDGQRWWVMDYANRTAG